MFDGASAIFGLFLGISATTFLFSAYQRFLKKKTYFIILAIGYLLALMIYLINDWKS